MDTSDVLSMALAALPPPSTSQRSSESESGSVSESPSSSSSTLASSTQSIQDLLTLESHYKNLHSGVKMTLKALLQTLGRFDIVEMESMNEKFDPNFHQALFQSKVAGKPGGEIYHVAKVGYKIGNRVLRPAQVGVTKEDE